MSVIRIVSTNKRVLLVYSNESTAGADASVEMPKLHNIKLLESNSFYTHDMMNN